MPKITKREFEDLFEFLQDRAMVEPTDDHETLSGLIVIIRRELGRLNDQECDLAECLERVGVYDFHPTEVSPRAVKLLDDLGSNGAFGDLLGDSDHEA